ncbi:putative disease resistance protein [Cardamine amara subsp. amara]|uniref:Disease resistance protein n=1 Tax=Cardamine amara subsp. amara TaxID=228776 RepID=A0ABD1AUA9_CARAN
MAVTDFFAGEIATELLKQLFFIPNRAGRYKNTVDNLITLIENIQPTIKEIQYSGVELPAHRQAQIGMLFETLEKGKKLTDKILTCNRWNMMRHIYLMRKMEKLEKTLSNFFRASILTHILADLHLLRANSDERFHEHVIMPNKGYVYGLGPNQTVHASFGRNSDMNMRVTTLESEFRTFSNEVTNNMLAMKRAQDVLLRVNGIDPETLLPMVPLGNHSARVDAIQNTH